MRPHGRRCGEPRAGNGRATGKIPPRARTAFITPRLPSDRRFRSHYGSQFHTKSAMRALLHTAFAALLARADVSQAAAARIAGVTARQVDN